MTDSRWNAGGSREQLCHRPHLNSKIKNETKNVLFSDSVLTQYVIFCQPAAAKLTLCVCVCQRGRSPPWNLYGCCWRGRRGRRDHWSVWKVQKCRSAIKVASSKISFKRAEWKSDVGRIIFVFIGISRSGVEKEPAFTVMLNPKQWNMRKPRRGKKAGVKLLLSNRCVSSNLTEINVKHIDDDFNPSGSRDACLWHNLISMIPS